jgi:hypothetical protein
MLKKAGIDFLFMVNNHASDCDVYERVTNEERQKFLKQSKITPLSKTTTYFIIIIDISFSFFALDDVTNPISLERHLPTDNILQMRKVIL